MVIFNARFVTKQDILRCMYNSTFFGKILLESDIAPNHLLIPQSYSAVLGLLILDYLEKKGSNKWLPFF